MDLLVENGIVSSQEVTLPIVSAAISHLWQNLSEEKKASLLQDWAQKHRGLPGLGAGACWEPACAEGSMKDSGVESQGASCSLLSTPEEVTLCVGWGGVRWRGCADRTSSPQVWGYQGSAQGHLASLRCCLDSGSHSRFLIFPTLSQPEESLSFFFLLVSGTFHWWDGRLNQDSSGCKLLAH